ncbi:hypothetical protein [Nevskia ramosa]|uniref:hypothetical protein n=1 Tax=Nevskia ramosa TaxID=64002 RepID=UPI0003B4726D|nr:hypothetical protein [Nevskia ramosa]
MSASTDESSRQLRGAIALLKAGIDRGSARIEETHLAIADKPFRVLAFVPVVAQFSGVVRQFHDGITKGVHLGVRGLSAVGCDAAIRVLDQIQDQPGRVRW